MDGLRPHHTTRMGPVVRHLTHLLAGSAAPTKLLLMVSDGRPFDLDYGQQYGEDAVLDYAVQDTAMALTEARERGVRPYLVTVDAAGAGYLGQICQPHEYHVIADPRDLPASLAALYLTARAQSALPISSLNTSDLMVTGTVFDG
jgi:nitric oxide reductase activation protein